MTLAHKHAIWIVGKFVHIRSMCRSLTLTLIAGVLAAGLTVTPTPTTAQTDGRLDILFDRLASTTNLVEARSIETAIWDVWVGAGNDDIDVLMARGVEAMNGGKLGVALAFFEEVTREAPEMAEGWNKRATVHYLLQNFDASVADIARTLKLEPRHFGALSGLGLINMSLGRDEAALKAFEQALKIYPLMSGGQERIRALRERLKGDET